MSTYFMTPSVVRVGESEAVLLQLSFGDLASSPEIVKEADATMSRLKSEELKGGKLVLLNGRASLAVIATITHHVAHLYGAVAIFDPKLSGYVVVISHDPQFHVGDVLTSR